MEIINTDSLYWFLSTTAQVLATIVGLLGMAAIYKLQLITNSIDGLMKASLNSRRLKWGHLAHYQKPEQFISMFETDYEDDLKLKPEQTTDIRYSLFNDLKPYWEMIQIPANRKDRVIDNIKAILSATTILIISCSLGLVFVDTTKEWVKQNYDFCLLLLFLVTIVSFAFYYFSISKLIKD